MRVLRVVRGAPGAAADMGGRAATNGAGTRQVVVQRPGSQPASPDRAADVASMAHRAGVHSIEHLLRLLSPRGLDEVQASLAAMQQGQPQEKPARQQQRRAAAAQQRAQLGAAGGEAPHALVLPLPVSLL